MFYAPTTYAPAVSAPTHYCKSHLHPFPLRMYHRVTVNGKYILACPACRYIVAYRVTPFGLRFMWKGDGARFVV